MEEQKTIVNEQVQNQQFITDSNIVPIMESTELGESLKLLNEDKIEEQTRMSSIDLKARLHYIEISHILAMDALVQLNVLPVKCLGFTRQKKRLSVSLDGQGRKEFVSVVSGKRELEERTGIMGGIRKMFSKKEGTA
jgi:hypothetical protein